MEGCEGFLYKRAPRNVDTDKSSLSRLIKKSSAYKRRYFVLNPSEAVMLYYANDKKDSMLGQIDVRTVSEIIVNHLEDEVVPSEWALNLVTPTRTWILYADTIKDRDMWKNKLQSFVVSHSTDEIITSRKQASQPSLEVRQSVFISRRVTSFLTSPSFAVEEGNQRINMIEQTKRMQDFKSRDFGSCVTGNTPLNVLSIFSQINLLDHDFYLMLRSWCPPGSSDTHDDIVTHLLENAVFDMCVKEGSMIVSEGGQLQYVYFIINGTVYRRKEWSTSKSSIAHTLRSGQCFGDVEAILFNGRSPYTLLVGANSTFMKIERNLFMQLFATKEDLVANHMTSSSPMMGVFSSSLESGAFAVRTNILIQDVLSCHGLFEPFPPATITAITSLFKPYFIPAGEILIHEGDLSESIYFILQGTCNVLKKGLTGAQEVVHSTSSGDWMGEIGLFKNKNRGATVVAFTDVIAIVTDALGFQRFIDLGGPSVRQAVEKSASNQMSVLVKKIPLFQDLEDLHIENISNVLTFQHILPQTQIITHDSSIDTFYVVIHGQVELTVMRMAHLQFNEDPPIIDVLSEGDCMGEGAVLYNEYTATTSCKTSSETSCLALVASVSDMKNVISVCPSLRMRLEEREKARKARLDLIRSLTLSLASSLNISYGDGSTSPNRMASSETLSDMKMELDYLREEVIRCGGKPFEKPTSKKVLRELKLKSEARKSNISNDDLLVGRKRGESMGDSPHHRRASLKQILGFGSSPNKNIEDDQSIPTHAPLERFNSDTSEVDSSGKRRYSMYIMYCLN